MVIDPDVDVGDSRYIEIRMGHVFKAITEHE